MKFLFVVIFIAVVLLGSWIISANVMDMSGEVMR